MIKDSDQVQYFYVPADEKHNAASRKYNLIIKRRAPLVKGYIDFTGLTRYAIVARQKPQSEDWELLSKKQWIFSNALPQGIGLLKPEAQIAWKLRDNT